MMAESKVMLDGRFRVFADGTVNRILSDGSEVAAVLSYGSRNKAYASVSYQDSGKQKREYVHRLVAGAFLPNPDNLPQVNHKDGNPRNNAADNLEWCTAKHNIQHAYAMGLINHRRQLRTCAGCGDPISDNSKGLCADCMQKASAAGTFRTNRVFFGVVEYSKRIEGITNEDIARRTGYAKDTIDKFMCGQRVTKNVAYKICDLLSIDKSLFCAREN